MNDDYFWDRSGTPDPEVERLENLLGPLRHRGTPPELPTVMPSPKPTPRVWTWLAAAAVFALLLGGSAWLLRLQASRGWEVVRLEGAPRVGAGVITDSGRLRVGQVLETDAASRARIAVGFIGEVEVEPRTRLRLVRARETDHRLALERGTMHAVIWAPPRLFYVETPAGLAVDLGCAYTLEVDEDGDGLLRVSSGWVGFEHDGLESFVPAGALSPMRAEVGPGTPYFEDAPPELQEGLLLLDFEAVGAPERPQALDTVLSSARPRDAFTLWHLLSRLPVEERGRVFDRLAELVPPPVGVTREGVLRRDQRMLDLWWDELGLGDTSWWRLWKGNVPSSSQ